MVQRKTGRSRQELSNEYLLAKCGFDTAENEPSKVWPIPQRVQRGGRARVVRDRLAEVRDLLRGHAAERGPRAPWSAGPSSKFLAKFGKI